MELILYSTGCPRCKTLGMMLDKKKIPYTINSNLDDMEKLGVMSVPVLVVDGEMMTYEMAMQWIAKQQEGLNEKQ